MKVATVDCTEKSRQKRGKFPDYFPYNDRWHGIFLSAPISFIAPTKRQLESPQPQLLTICLNVILFDDVYCFFFFRLWLHRGKQKRQH